jgi:signal transduction histidine kinase
MSAAALLFARGFVETRAVAPRLDTAILGLVGAAGVLSVAGVVVPESTLKGLAYLHASIGAAACLGAGVLAHARGRPAMRFFIIGWVGVLVGVLANSIANNFPPVIPPDIARLIPKLTILFDALLFYTALSDRARAWRVQRDRAIRGELEALRVQQQTAEQLHRAERERLEALVLARTKSEQLAMASHDIRQPLASLRLTLERLVGADGAPAATAYGARQSLDYLEKLAREYGASEAVPANVPPTAASRPSFPMTTLLRNIDLMFRDEAEAKGLTFRCRPSAAVVQGDAMSAMRLVSNLVANAIKYTERGKVLVGCRRVAGAIRVVVADTGLGIAADERARVLLAGERGTAARETEGHGLGLAIVAKLAEQCGYRLDYRSWPGRGTVFFVDLPLGPAAGR